MMLDKVQKAALMPFHLNSHQNRQNMAARRGDGERTNQDCCNLMTRGEKVLLFLLILSLLVLVTVAVFVINHFLQEKTCDTYKCIEASYTLFKTIDFDTNPCNDYHQFVCGNYLPLGEDNKEVELVTTDLQEEDSPHLKTVKKFYQACINESAIEEDNESTLFSIISQIGGWPLFLGNDWNGENFSWQRYMANVGRYGVKTDWLLSFDYYEENGINLLLIKPPELNASSSQFKSAYYHEIIAQLATKLKGSGAVEEQLNQMMNFESKLYDISSTARRELLENDHYVKKNLSNANNSWPENFLYSILNESVFIDSTVVVVAPKSYLYHLNQLLTGVSKRTQANYFVWKTVETFLPYCSNHIREVYAKYVQLGTREEHCLSETVRRFHSVIENEYISKYKSDKTSSLIGSIVNLIYQSYNENEDVSANVHIEGLEGENTGVTSIEFISDNIISMIAEIQIYIENEFYKCLYKSEDCVREGYYEDTKELETYFDTSDNTFHISYDLVYSDSFTWYQPNFINFAQIGRTIGDKIIEAEEETHNSTIDKLGVDLAYEGYIKWIQREGIERKLPALNYTTKQLFWIHSSSMYCASEDDLYKFEEVARSQYFKKDFECT